MFKCEVIGNIGADAEVKESNGKKFVTFRVAHSDSYVDASGQKHENTDWIDCVMSNVDSKVIPYLLKGVKVFVRGNARLRCYSSPKLRQMVAGLTINALEIELCGGSGEEVPSQLINPDTGSIYDVTKYYWCNCPVDGMKSDDIRMLIDNRGRQYGQNGAGFVAPVPADVDTSQSEDKSSVNSEKKKKK